MADASGKPLSAPRERRREERTASSSAKPPVLPDRFPHPQFGLHSSISSPPLSPHPPTSPPPPHTSSHHARAGAFSAPGEKEKRERVRAVSERKEREGGGGGGGRTVDERRSVFSKETTSTSSHSHSVTPTSRPGTAPVVVSHPSSDQGSDGGGGGEGSTDSYVMVQSGDAEIGGRGSSTAGAVGVAGEGSLEPTLRILRTNLKRVSQERDLVKCERDHEVEKNKTLEAKIGAARTHVKDRISLLDEKHLAQIQQMEDTMREMEEAHRGELEQVKRDAAASAKQHNRDHVDKMKTIISKQGQPEMAESLKREYDRFESEASRTREELERREESHRKEVERLEREKEQIQQEHDRLLEQVEVERREAQSPGSSLERDPRAASQPMSLNSEPDQRLMVTGSTRREMFRRAVSVGSSTCSPSSSLNMHSSAHYIDQTASLDSDPGAKMIGAHSSIRMDEYKRTISSSDSTSSSTPSTSVTSSIATTTQRLAELQKQSSVSQLQDTIQIQAKEIEALKKENGERAERITALSNVVQLNQKTAQRGIRGQEVDEYLDNVSRLVKQLSEKDEQLCQQGQKLTEADDGLAQTKRSLGTAQHHLKETEREKESVEQSLLELESRVRSSSEERSVSAGVDPRAGPSHDQAGPSRSQARDSRGAVEGVSGEGVEGGGEEGGGGEEAQLQLVLALSKVEAQDRLLEELRSKLGTAEELVLKYERARSSSSHHDDDVAQLNRQLKELQAKLTVAEEMVLSYQRTQSSSRDHGEDVAQLKSKEMDRAHMAKQMEKFEKVSSSWSKLGVESRELSERVMRLEGQLEGSEAEKRRLTSKLTSLGKDLSRVHADSAAKEAQLEKMQQDKLHVTMELQGEVRRWRGQAERLEQKELQGEVRRWRGQAERLEQKELQLEAVLTNLKSECYQFKLDLDQANATATRMMSDNEALEKTKLQLLEDLELEKLKASTYEMDFQQERTDRENMSNRVNAVEEEYKQKLAHAETELRRSVGALDQHKRALSDTETLMQATSEQISRQLTVKGAELAAVKEEVLTKTQQLRQYKKQVDQFRTENEAFTLQAVAHKEVMEKLGNRSESLATENESLRTELGRLQRANAAIERSTGGPAKGKSVAELEQDVKRLRVENIHLSQQYELLKQRLEASHPPSSTSHPSHLSSSTSHPSHPPSSTAHPSHPPSSTSHTPHPHSSTSHTPHPHSSTSHTPHPHSSNSHPPQPLAKDISARLVENYPVHHGRIAVRQGAIKGRSVDEGKALYSHSSQSPPSAGFKSMDAIGTRSSSYGALPVPPPSPSPYPPSPYSPSPGQVHATVKPIPETPPISPAHLGTAVPCFLDVPTSSSGPASLPSPPNSHTPSSHLGGFRDDMSIGTGGDFVEKDSPPSSNIGQPPRPAHSHSHQIASIREENHHGNHLRGDLHGNPRGGLYVSQHGGVLTNAAVYSGASAMPSTHATSRGQSANVGSNVRPAPPTHQAPLVQPRPQAQQGHALSDRVPSCHAPRPHPPDSRPLVQSAYRPPISSYQTPSGLPDSASPEAILMKGLDSDIHRVASNVNKAVEPEPEPEPARSVAAKDIPFDPNLVCPQCRVGFRLGEIQRFRRHVKSCK